MSPFMEPSLRPLKEKASTLTSIKSKYKKKFLAYSISSSAETRDRALSFSWEVESAGWLPVAFLVNSVFYYDTYRNRTPNFCTMSLHA